MSFSYGNYPPLSSVERILVIKLRHLGDVLLSSPLFSHLKRQFPMAQIDAYVWKEAGPMLEGHTGVDHLLFYDRSWKTLPFWQRMREELRLLRHIRKARYDLVINLTEGDRGALAAWASQAPVCVGVDPGRSGFLGKRRIYSHLVKPCPTPRHTVERDLDALRRIGLFPRPEERSLELFIPEAARAKAQQLLSAAGVTSGEYTLIHPVSRWGFKSPPPEIIAAAIDQLDDQVVLTGGPSEREQAFIEEIIALCPRRVVNLAGKTSLKELGALMQLARGMITVDSVALHMGSALQVPLVALFGPTCEKNWGPWMHPKAVVVTKPVACRPCRLDGCGGSKRSDCLWTLSPQAIVNAYQHIVSSSEAAEMVVKP